MATPPTNRLPKVNTKTEMPPVKPPKQSFVPPLITESDQYFIVNETEPYEFKIKLSRDSARCAAQALNALYNLGMKD